MKVKKNATGLPLKIKKPNMKKPKAVAASALQEVPDSSAKKMKKKLVAKSSAPAKNKLKTKKLIKKAKVQEKEQSEDEDMEFDSDLLSSGKVKKNKLLKKKVKKPTKGSSKDLGSSSESSDDEGEIGNLKDHKKDLEKLKESDPEFYKYLKENDEDLLNFDDMSDSDREGEESVHHLPDKLEVASDDSDFEPEEEVHAAVRSSNNVTLKSIEEWRERLQTDKTSKTLREVLEAFEAALQCVIPENERTPCRLQVEGSAVFNAVLRLCIIDVQPAIKRFLNIPDKSRQPPPKSPNWAKIRTMLREYLLNLTRLCQVTSPGMLSVLLKHVHQMLPYAVCYPNIASRLLTRLVSLWTHDEDVVRVLAFLCLLRIANLRKILLPHILKKMYLSFVRNSKFISPHTLPGLNFLRQSLAEMFVLDPVLSYQHGFLYIRQLSIHLRNAVTLKKKESYQAVYNWQFVQSLQLWSEALSLAPTESPLASLTYPLVQITLGTIKLVPSAQYYPLRFHCIKLLIGLMEKQGVYIPVLPLLLEVLRDFDFNRKHTKVSMKPMDLSCVLRCSKLQMQENGWKDAIIEWLTALLLEAFTVESHRLAFPDIVVPAVIQLKKFLKTCRIAKYSRQVKVVLDKVQENAKMVEQERSKVNVRLDDAKGVAAIEATIRAKGTPLAKYFQQWQKIHQQTQAKKFTDNESIGDFKLPTLYKFSKKQSRDKPDTGPVELFPSDEDSDNDMPAALLDSEDDETAEEPSKKRAKKDTSKKNKKKRVEEVEEAPVRVPEDWPEMESKDIVQDLDVSDFM